MMQQIFKMSKINLLRKSCCYVGLVSNKLMLSHMLHVYFLLIGNCLYQKEKFSHGKFHRPSLPRNYRQQHNAVACLKKKI
jgi:hypothetical protein